MSGQFAGKVAVVTGGTLGVGESAARLMAERGLAGLVICGRNAERGEAVARDLNAAGTPTVFVRADMESVDDCFAVVDRAAAEFGGLHVLVNAAGNVERGLLEETSPALFDRIFAVNMRAPFFLSQRAVPHMKAAGGGSIVNIASINANGGAHYLSAYSASKGALSVWTRNAANALRWDRIRVNAVNLGWTDSPNERLVQQQVHGRPPGWEVEADAQQPFGRLIKPADIARVIAFLACDESGIMTGAVFDYEQRITGTPESPRPA